MNSSAGFSVPLPPALPSNGSLPAQRLQTQLPPEPPACVQNAMMTKDKKPFTYTPGGIDLSQIKSPRMAKRIARNAQYEGVTNQPKPSPLAQDQQQHVGAAPPPPASAMGMPVQVFPTGPPPPPPAPPSSSTSSISHAPPPPPPMSQLTPQTNGRDTRKSPTPQNFEPPPLGCRPEIKIPPNPMAILKKVPKPQPKNEFWKEEYCKERSKSPLPNEANAQNVNQQQIRTEAPPSVPSPQTTKSTNNNDEDYSNPRKDPNRIAFQQQRQPIPPPPPQPQQQHQQYQPPMQTQMPFQPQRPAQQSSQYQNQDPSYPPHMDPNRIAFQQQRQQPGNSGPARTPAGPYQLSSPNTPRVDSPFRSQDNSSLHRPQSPVRSQTSVQQQQPQTPIYVRQSQQQQPTSPYQQGQSSPYQQPQSSPYQQSQSSYQQPQSPYQQTLRQNVTSPPPQQKPTQVGSLYIAPVSPEHLATGNEQSPRPIAPDQQPAWLSQRPNVKEHPDWVREVNSPPTANRTQTPPINANSSSSGPGLRLQMSVNTGASNGKERIIPIQLEKTPTPTRTPSTPGFGPQPYSPGNQQYGSVSSPGSGYSSPNVAIVRNPNHFVDQGYNTYPNQQQQQQRVMSPPATQSGAGRVIPISIERDDGPFNPNVVRGPVPSAPMVIQNDPRSISQDRSNGIPPNQSKSFRVLQRITDTDGGRESDGEQQAELHEPQFSRQMGDATDQMRRMQVNDGNQQAFVNRGPIQRQTQRYVQQRPIYQDDEKYVHPSEQQVQEPKIYTGSAIPSRSFKILQAMTTPENAVETEDSMVVENDQNNYPSCEYPYPDPNLYPPNAIPCSNSDDTVWQSHDQYYPFYQPYSYYYPQYDREGNGDYGNDFSDERDIEPVEGTPDIVITASPDDEDQQHERGLSNDNKNESSDKMEESPLDVLTRRLSQFISPDIDNFVDNADLNITLETNQIRASSESRKSENCSEDESDELFTSSSSSEELLKEKITSSGEGLHAIRSVTNIKVYEDEEDSEEQESSREAETNERNQEKVPLVLHEDDEETTRGFAITEWNDDDDSSSNECDKDQSAECIIDSGSDDEDYETNELPEDFNGVEIQNQLSVIYEESLSESVEKREKRRTESFNSTSSTISDCSTTIANDDQDDEEEEAEEDDENNSDTEAEDDSVDDEDAENSVTVRLPLRLSFSRTSNDENITTVVVGDSEIQDSRRSSLKTIEDTCDFDWGDEAKDEEDGRQNDVSVTFSLASRSNSMDRSGLLSKTSSVDRETSAKDWDDSDSESVSISVSLPMKRNKFMTQTLNNDLTNDIYAMKSDWDKSDVEEEEEDETKRDESTLVDCIPETITEEDDEEDVEEKSSEEEETSSSSNEQLKISEKMTAVCSIQNTVQPDDGLLGSANEMFDALRELRVWNDTMRRATEERDLIEKNPQISTTSQEEDNITKMFDDLKQEEWKRLHEENEEDDNDTDTSTSESSSSSSEEENKRTSSLTDTVSDADPWNHRKSFTPLEESLSFVLEETKRKCDETLKETSSRKDDNAKLSVRDRIAAFEASKETPLERAKTPRPVIEITNRSTSVKKEILSRNSSLQRSESELDETDSGVTSDMSKPVSETDTDPECFTELKKMSRYQRAATHSRLFKLLQDESTVSEEPGNNDNDKPPAVVLRHKKKIVHNVSITRRSNPDALKEAETMLQRRERLSLPLKLSNSIDADNLSTSNSPCSPGQVDGVSEQLIRELIESLLLKKDSSHLRNLPWEKLQAAAKKVLQEGLDIDSLENTSIESTPAMTPQEMKGEYQKSYTDYYESWNRSDSPRTSVDSNGSELTPSKSNRSLHNQSPSMGQNQFRNVRCPRVLSSKTINRDLSRVTESRESESPDRFRSPRSSATPERSRDYLRATSLSRIGRV